MSASTLDIDTLSPIERVRLIGDLWDSLTDAETELSDAWRAELERRDQELDADIAAGRPLGSSWADVRARIEARRRRN